MAQREAGIFLAESVEMAETVDSEKDQAELAQIIFEHAVPLEGSIPFLELVEERNGLNGRELVAKEAIRALTFAPVQKVRLMQTEDELNELECDFDAFVRVNVPEILGFPSLFSYQVQAEQVPHGSEMCLYVGMFLRQGLMDDPMIAHLMDYDCFGHAYVTETFTRMMPGDILWLHYWTDKLQGIFEADMVWRVSSFALSHAFLNDRHTLTFSPFCLANCPKARWDWYAAGSDEANPPVSGSASGDALDALLGNFEEIAPWGRCVFCDAFCVVLFLVTCIIMYDLRQKTVAPGQIPADECVIFTKNVRKGEAVELDFGTQYMLSPESQIHKYEGSEIGRLMHAVMKQFDPRVRSAFEKFML
jgi:hypothetical protein